ncbi:TPA: hypothetical protein DCG82_00995 [candidate division WOR-3]|uniref:Uncharacterized protein n=1 Tax=candidate division WOR-3 bacterium TaxID=2052148 RepID=A0A348MIU6_UNCW3|nr:hypothetical protein [candidate division WOR-3 bacterium]HCP16886.1 hypothetical protein [candidate division WOR-3 bacterium]
METGVTVLLLFLSLTSVIFFLLSRRDYTMYFVVISNIFSLIFYFLGNDTVSLFFLIFNSICISLILIKFKRDIEF